LLAAEQQREDAQRALYLAHRGVSELAGQLQSQQGKLESARNRIERIDARTGAVGQHAGSRAGAIARGAPRVEHAVSAMGDLETARQALDAERRQLAEARDAARLAARESRDAAHALALTLESQRVQVVALAQALERMGGQRGQLDSRLGDLAAQLAEGDAPVQSLENERQVALTERVRSERELAEARSTARRHRQRPARLRTDPPAARRAGAGAARGDWPAPARPAGAGAEGGPASRPVVEAGFVLDDVINTLPRTPMRALGKGRRRLRRQAAPAGAGQPGRHPEHGRGQRSARSTWTRRTPTSRPRWKRWKRRSARSTARPAAASRTPSTASMPACRSCIRACSAAATPTWN
jgi:chromosome segregation protein